MENLINHPIIVGDPDQMERDAHSGEPICPECAESFFGCTCPKPWSTVDSDGYHIIIEKDRMVAYPTEETYREETLWITGTPHVLICGICMQTMGADEQWSEKETELMAWAFFEIHKWCYSPNRSSGSQYEF